MLVNAVAAIVQQEPHRRIIGRRKHVTGALKLLCLPDQTVGHETASMWVKCKKKNRRSATLIVNGRGTRVLRQWKLRDQLRLLLSLELLVWQVPD